MDKGVEILKENMETLNKSLMRLSESFLKCKEIGMKDEFSSQELTEFEALTARFARTVDLFINKCLRSLYKVEREEVITVIDILNNAEKRDVIESAKIWTDIKDLRNSIIHDYDVDDFPDEIFKPVLQYAPIVEGSIAKLKTYCDKYLSAP
ncbi:MAG: hypothetical protein FWC26_05980 [Fibromonadales bacterium]|nr:hypothetical protein [Fibromonadales bacterium]